MLEDHVAVKQAHNIEMQCSGSSAGTVTHFPNYHIDRCNALEATDAKNSAASTHIPTWMVQHLAAMMPLTGATCQKLMAIHTVVKVPDCNVIVAAEILTGKVPATEAAGRAANLNLDRHGFATNGTPVGAGLRSSCDEYRATLMRLLMSVVSCEKASEKDDTNVTYVPEFARNALMQEFATALKTNKTYSDGLGKALEEAIPEASGGAGNHVPFCGLTACKNLSATGGAFTDIASGHEAMRNSLNKPLPWKHCTVRQEMPINPRRGTKDSYDQKMRWQADESELGGRLVKSKGWNDVYVGEVFLWISDAENRPGMVAQAPEGGPLHPLRSFDPGCAKGPVDPSAQPLHNGMKGEADMAAAWCMDPSNWDEFWGHVVLVLAARFYKASARFVNDGDGVPAWNETAGAFVPTGHHIMHGSQLPKKGTAQNSAGTIAQDIVILRPNIEHEMLGIIMGRGGTQELGSTFWGQTELSCYDDAQHGIWGMSYKYHERAMVTNERNLIRTYDVAFDGYNGGMDQSHVIWEDQDSRSKFANAVYDRNQPYHGPSMMVMSFPPHASKQAWPNPIVFHNAAPVGASIDPEKSQGGLPDLQDHMVFSHTHNPKLCPLSTHQKFDRYMTRLEMTQWASADQSTRPAGEACIANETSSSPLAFQGSMRVLNSYGQPIEDIKGSGHLGHSYVGIASVREGRGVLNGAGPPMMGRMI